LDLLFGNGNTMSTLYIVATPIGNLGDISSRALDVLRGVDTIVCEDTRHSKKLLMHYEISKPMHAFHAHSDNRDVQKLIGWLKEGKDLAYISDAGTPGISDPGFMLTSACVKEGITIVPIPGASAFVTALMASGLPINNFWYVGYLPAKKGRQKLFDQFHERDSTIVFYESKYRLGKMIEGLLERMPDRIIVVAKELTKMHETFFRGTVAELADYHKDNTAFSLGEFVVILGPKDFSFE